jgi:hypothetical protein
MHKQTTYRWSMLAVVFALMAGCGAASLPGRSANSFAEGNLSNPRHTLTVTSPVSATDLLDRQKKGADLCWSGERHTNGIAPAGPGVFVPVVGTFRQSVELMPESNGGGMVLLSVDGALGRMFFFGVRLSPAAAGGSRAEVFPVPMNRRDTVYQDLVLRWLAEGTLLCHHPAKQWSKSVAK